MPPVWERYRHRSRRWKRSLRVTINRYVFAHKYSDEPRQRVAGAVTQGVRLDIRRLRPGLDDVGLDQPFDEPLGADLVHPERDGDLGHGETGVRQGRETAQHG